MPSRLVRFPTGLLAALTFALLASSCTVSKAKRQGDRWMEKERPAAAARAYETGVEKKPENTKLQLRLARAYLASGEPEAALAPAKAAFDAEEEGSAEVMALVLVRIHQWKEAIPLLTDALVESDNPDLLSILAEARLSIGQSDLAIESAREAKGSSPANDVFLAYLLARNNKPEEAKEIALSAQASAVNNPEVLADAAVALYLAGAHAGSRAAASKALGLAGGDVADWVDDAQSEYAVGALEVALRKGMRAWVLNPENPRLAWTLGNWWLEVGEPMWAIDLLLVAFRHPDYTFKENAGVQVYELVGMKEEDRRADRYAIAMSLAKAFGDLGSYRDQVEMLKEAARSVPTAESYMQLSDTLIALGRTAEAQQAAQQALQYGPSDGNASARLARAAGASGDYGQAIKYGLQALRYSPDNAGLILMIAGFYESNNDLGSALQLVEQGLRANPGNTDLQITRERLRRVLDM